MPITIKRLNCRVKVYKRSSEPVLFKSEESAKPAMQFVLPNAQPETVNAPEPSKMATQDYGSGAGERKPVSARNVDPRAVADRVYNLMKQELKSTRERTGPW